MAQTVYSFNEGNKNMRAELGGKGANLSEMTQIGIPVPFGFILGSSLSKEYDWEKADASKEIEERVFEKLQELSEVSGKKLGDSENPLFLSVRSSASTSMPGMMDTILNLGMNDVTVEAFGKIKGNREFAYRNYRKFIYVYSQKVMGVESENFSAITLSKDDKLDEIIEEIEIMKAVVLERVGEEFPQDVNVQLFNAISGVFRSWNNSRAELYRERNGIDASSGTAVVVQQMVFGNVDSNSGAGVVFSKNPIYGEDELYGEFIVNGQGDEIAGGFETPRGISELSEINKKVHKTVTKIAAILEEHFCWVQNIEFTVEEGKVYILQSKNAKMSIKANVKNAVKLQAKGYFNKSEAIMRLPQNQLNYLLNACHELDKSAEDYGEDKILDCKSASVSTAEGRLCIFVDSAKSMFRQGEKVIFACDYAKPDFYKVLDIAEGMIVSRGGGTSHLAVIARSLDKPFLIAKEEFQIDYENALIKIGEQTYREGELLTLDSDSAAVYRGVKKRKQGELCSEFDDLLAWADERRKLKVRANISAIDDADKAIVMGAEGVGLCRTEHIFDEIHINDILTLLFSDMDAERRLATEKLIVVQKNFLKKVFSSMRDKPVTVRLMDPVLHDWLPKDEAEMEKIADRLSMPISKLRQKLSKMTEMNPHLGYRGCRITIKYPEITNMQAIAIAMAVIEIKREQDIDVKPEIMVPLVGVLKEYQFVKKLLVTVLKNCMEDLNQKFEYSIGAMIEVPRAILLAGELAKEADFLSFGTNDLTQLSFGISKGNVQILMNKYKESSILRDNPFETLDIEGVGAMLSMAAEKARAAKPNIKIGVCGKQSGNPESIEFYHKLGLNYISCEPSKVPGARISAAQAVINEK